LRKKVLILLFALAFMTYANAFPTPSKARSQGDGKLYSTQETQRYVVGFIGVANQTIITDVGGEIIHVFALIPAIAANLTLAMADTLRNMTSTIEYVEEDFSVGLCDETLPWGVARIGANNTHSYDQGFGVKVAVLDTGIDTNHPDLMSNYKGGYDFVDDDNNPTDDNGHGTHVSGIIAAVAGNGIGVIGVAPKAYLYAVKVCDAQGFGSLIRIIEGIEWAVDNGMKIISMSVGGIIHSFAEEYACQRAYDSGLLLVAAAGNEWGGPVTYPARFPSVIAVSATCSNDSLAEFSSRGEKVELAAPGHAINSTMPTYAVYLNNNPNQNYSMNYDRMSGTSMACPHVTGTAALVWFRYPSMTNVEVRQRLRIQAEDLGEPLKYGYGLVDAEKSAPPPPPSGVGGFLVPVDKFGLLVPYIGLASTILVGTVATTVYVKHAKRKKKEP
jgi:subtilisin